MPWVDPETVGPQNISYYAWNFAVFAIPNIFLICAVLFARRDHAAVDDGRLYRRRRCW